MPQAQQQIRNPTNPSLVALTPRQVILANPKMGESLISNTHHKDNKTILLHSIAQYLQQCGFCKTLKKFRSEAQLQQDCHKATILDLEEICIKYFETADALANAKGVEQALMNGKGDAEADPELGILGKKKKKRHDGSSDAAVDNFEPLEKSTLDDKDMANGEPQEKVKSKEKKKNKDLSDSIRESKTPNLEDSKQPGIETLKLEDVSKKKKEKLSKKSAVVSESQIETVREQSKASKTRDAASSEVEKKSKDKKKKKSKELDQENDAKILGKIPQPKEDKGLKKRKRKEPEEDHSMLGDKNAPDESKFRKTDSMGEEKSSTQQVQASESSDDGKGSHGHHANMSVNELHKTPSKQLDGQENGESENGGKSATQGSSKKQHKGSAEPTTARAFQRIKVEEVEFVDNRLKDNSYWAKDGADNGYGAKAQEILGQVRGRGFRHEKTKKKRGTYRGGQIDLQSHSVKFNYSDDEE